VDELMEVVLLTGMAGMAIPAGGALAAVERIRPSWLETELRHFVIAFGGGVLLAAVSLVLVPVGASNRSAATVVICMIAGGLTFMLIDIALARHRSSASQLVAMLADFVPEALALGAMFAAGAGASPLLAMLITLQNLPEGFNAFREIKASGGPSNRVVLLGLLTLVPLGPAAGLVGMFLLSDLPAMVDSIMLFAAAGILYLTFQDIAPQARLERHWAPPLGAVAGFLLGLLGHMLVH
jgi:ZIP family zinc transporter